MVNVVVTEIPPKLEPVREDSFVSVAISDHSSESRLHRIADLFGSERGRRAIATGP